MPKSTKSSKSSKKSKKSDLNELKPNVIKEKVYITKEIQTSITLLASPEHNIVLESLLFLSKYADIQPNNIIFLQSNGIIPKLLALLEHNICIVRVALKLLSLLITNNEANIELNEDKNNESVLKICKIYTQSDLSSKEYAITILAIFCQMGKAEIFLSEPEMVKTILKSIKVPENDIILFRTLEVLSKLIEIQQFLIDLSMEENFNIPTFLNHMYRSEDCFKLILEMFEKMTFFSDDCLQQRLKECNLVEHMFTLIIDSTYKSYQSQCLCIVSHSMLSEKTNRYFVQSLQFLQFCQWVKTCSSNVLPACAYIFLELSKIDDIRQTLFDLNVEDSILSFLRSEDKKILLLTFEAISHMSKHKYCCRKLVIPAVIKKILTVLNTEFERQNEIALTTLHYLSRRDSQTIHMIVAYDGVKTLLKYLRFELSEPAYLRLLEIANMIANNYQLQQTILIPELYSVLLDKIHIDSQEIIIRSLEILLICEPLEDFQTYFIDSQESIRIVNKLQNETNMVVFRNLIVFIHNAMVFDKLATDFVHGKLLPVLKTVPSTVKVENPLIDRLIQLVYDCYLPLKFFETGRLEMIDKIKDRFYIIDGVWKKTFPFLEVLQLRQISTKNTIYVIVLNQQENVSDKSLQSIESTATITSANVDSSLHFGYLSDDPYMKRYLHEVKALVLGVKNIKEQIKLISLFIDRNLCGPEKEATIVDKMHTFRLHIECIREKLGTNMIPIGYLRLGFHCERALLFKVLADFVCIPSSLVKGQNRLYWNEIGLIELDDEGKHVSRKNVLQLYVVDLMKNIGQLMPVGSRDCNAYCNIP